MLVSPLGPRPLQYESCALHSRYMFPAMTMPLIGSYLTTTAIQQPHQSKTVEISVLEAPALSLTPVEALVDPT